LNVILGAGGVAWISLRDFSEFIEAEEVAALPLFGIWILAWRSPFKLKKDTGVLLFLRQRTIIGEKTNEQALEDTVIYFVSCFDFAF